ncbi:MAG: gamma-glutamylcyclotransferase [Marinibacterium sp.]|nr:gamma-glutamylcyclotransferase [Marinibacterium sp.]
MTDPFFFGYGSLVNRTTQDYPDCRPLRLRGWRRVWVDVPEFDRAILSAERCDGVEIDGLVARVPGADWQALDLRERLYERRDATADLLGDRPHHVAIYEIPHSDRVHPVRPGAILLSYLDVVIQGYLREFGPDGAAHFLDTTAGWNRPVLDDRATPIYPRHIRLAPHELTVVDDALARLGAQIVTP